MKIEENRINDHNNLLKDSHNIKFDFLSKLIPDSEATISKLMDFQIAIPSWALGSGGTRFGRFLGGGEPRNLEEKIEDVGLLHKLNRSSGAISLHIPWDVPKDYQAIKNLAAEYGLRFDAMNSNYFSGSRGTSSKL
jgi:L-rhamnose isomerase/sugar isomerase